MKRTTLIAALGLLAAWLPDAAAQKTKEKVDPAEWVPAEAVFYVGVVDTQDLWRDYQKTTGYRLMKDPEAGETLGMWGKTLERAKEKLAELFQVKPAALKNPLGGPLAFYLTAPPGGSNEELDGVLVAGVSDYETMQAYFGAVVNKLKENAETYETVSAGGETIHVFTSPKKEESKDTTPEEEFEFDESAPNPLMAGPEGIEKAVTEAIDDFFAFKDLPEKLACCLTRERLIVAKSTDQVRAVLARGSRSETLADTEDLRAMKKLFRPLGKTRLLVNVPRLFELAQGDEEDQGVQTVARVLGARGLRSIIGHLRMGKKSYDSKFELFFLMSGERSGLAKLLSMENRPITPPDWVPAGSVFYGSLNLDPPKLVDEILKIAESANPGTAQMMGMMLENGPPGPTGEPVNWRKQVIDHLNGPLVGALAFNRPYKADSMRAMLTLGHRNREAVNQLLTMVTMMMGMGEPGATPPAPRDFHGTPIHTVPPIGASCAVTENRILFGNQSAVEAALLGESGTSLAEDRNFRRARRYVPDEAWFVFYTDNRRLLEVFRDLNQAADLPPDSAEGSLKMMLPLLGVEIAEDRELDKLIEYSAQSIMTLATAPEGVRFTAVELKPPKPEE